MARRVKVIDGVDFEKTINYRLKTPLKEFSGHRYWTGIFYTEHMIDNWRDMIGSVAGRPGECILHDLDLNKDGTHRKDHVHNNLAWNNTTTALNAFTLFMQIGRALSKDGVNCFAPQTLEPIQDIGDMHNYLPHLTEDAIKKGKHQYSPDDVITYNGFDIGLYEQIGVVEKSEIRNVIKSLIVEKQITNYLELDLEVMMLGDSRYTKVLEDNVTLFNSLTKGMYQMVVSYKERYGANWQKKLDSKLNEYVGLEPKDNE